MNLCPEMCCRTGRGWASVPRRHASVVPGEQDGRVLEERVGNVIENAALGSLPQGAAGDAKVVRRQGLIAVWAWARWMHSGVHLSLRLSSVCRPLSPVCMPPAHAGPRPCSKTRCI